MWSKIALTGATWFVGSFLLEELVEQWKEVVLLKRSTSQTQKIDHIITNSLVETFDVDKSTIDKLFSQHSIDVVIHLATSYGRKWEQPSEIMNSAMYLPMQLLEWAINHGSSVFINTDSYFNQSIQLQDNIGIHAEAKRDFLKYAKRYLEDKSITFLNIVMWHVYGPRDHEKKLVPGVIRKLLQEDSVIDLVQWHNERNFIYVKDLVRVYTTLLQNIDSIKDSYIDVYDRTWEVVTVKEMVEMLQEITQSPSVFNFGALPDREKEIMKIFPDMTTLIHTLWWKPQYTIKQGLEETISYYRSLDTK